MNKDDISSALNNYRLYYDGDIELPAKSVVDFILNNGVLPDGVAVDEITDDIREFNRYNSKKLSQKTDLNTISNDWVLPEEYLKMDVKQRINSIALKHDSLYEERVKRRDKEYSLFVKYGLEDILRVVFYIVDEFRKKKIVWGTGRGSSCSSYLFYLMGLHSVDVIYYDIPIYDFFKGEKS
jgi:DNA polymerase III alpha subunit